MSHTSDRRGTSEVQPASEALNNRHKTARLHKITPSMLTSNDFYLYIILGLPTWTLVDGTWAILSQLADSAPEGYNISAYLILALTFGNIVPLVIGLSMQKSTSMLLSSVINVILTTGLVAGILMGVTWNITVSIAHSQVSVPLFILFFIVGACASSSNVTHYTYVAKAAAPNTTALATGMGLGSMTAGILALFQGLLLKDYGFSVTLFYIVLALLYIPAILCFAHLTRKNFDAFTTNDPETGTVVNKLVTDSKSSSSSGSDSTHSYELDNIPPLSTSFKNSDEEGEYKESDFLRDHAGILALQMMNASLGYGFVPAIISFACSKFENKNLVLLLATGICAVLDPLFKFLTYYVRIETFAGLRIASSCLVLLTLGLILCAALPGNLSLYKGAGGILPAGLYICFGALFGFTNTCVFRYFKGTITPHFVQHSYRWSGICSQTGALLGSLTAFLLIVSGSM